MIKQEFRRRIRNMKKTIQSKTGVASYTNFVLKGDELSFDRVNTGKRWALSIETLFNIYEKNDFINTKIVGNTIGSRVNSPSVAVLMAIKGIDRAGNKLKD